MAYFPASVGGGTVNYETVAPKAAYSSSSIKVAKMGNVVTLYIGGFADAMGSWTTINNSNLDAKYCPPFEIMTYSVTANANEVGLSIAPSGALQLKKGVGSAYYCISYLV